MRWTTIAWATALVLAIVPVARAQPAAVDGLVVLASPHDAAETEVLLTRAIEAAGLKVAFRLDHAANAASVGQSLPPTVVLMFGNPRAGTPLMAAQPTAGIDLPMKMLIWEEAGKVSLAYNDPHWLAARHGLQGQEEGLAKMATALGKLAGAATSP